MDYLAFPPEFNSARMYAGPGPESMLVAAAAWNGLAAELHSVASSYGSVIAGLTDGPWLGPSSTAMETAAMPYVEWLSSIATQAELTAAQAQAAAGAYQAAFSMTVPPQLIAENRAEQTMLVATNLLGQNTSAIMALETLYMEMWAQDAAAMYGYAADSTMITKQVTPLTPAPETTNLAGLAAQGAAVGQNGAASTSVGMQSTLSHLVSKIPTALQSLTSPGSSTSSTSGFSGLLNGLLGGSSSGSPIPGLGGSLLQNYATLPGWFGIEVGSSALAPLFQAMATPAATAADAGAAGAAVAADGAAAADLGAGAAAADLGVGAAAADLGGVAASVGPLSVPTTWGWAAAGLPPMLGSVELAAPAMAGANLGAGLGFPFMFPPGMAGAAGRTATAGVTGAVAGAAAAKYLPRMSVVGGKSDVTAGESNLPPLQNVPAGFPTNGHTPPGYRVMISYVPTNGHEPSQVEA